MSPGPQQDGALQNVAAYKRWLDRYLGEAFGVVPMHRISGSLSSQQLGEAASEDDARFSDAREPTGPAGGVLSGTYPDPGFASDMATQAELDAHEADTSTHGSADLSQAALKNAANTFTATPQRVEGATNRVDLTTAGVVQARAIDGSRIASFSRDEILLEVDTGTFIALSYSTGSDSFFIRFLNGSEANARLEIVGDDGTIKAGDGIVAPTVAGFRSTNSIAGTPDANTFTQTQTITPTGDTTALELKRGTDSSPTAFPFRVRNAAGTQDLMAVDQDGGVNVRPTGDTNLLNLTRGTDTSPTQALIRIRNNAQTQALFTVAVDGKTTAAGGLDAGSQRVTSVADATAATEAATKGQLDTGLATKLAKTTDALGTLWGTRGQALAAPTSTGHAGTNFMHHVTIAVPQKCTVAGIRYKVGATSSGNVTVALYNAATTRVGEPASAVAQAAANTRQEVAFNATATLDPGIYTALVRLTSGTGTAFCWAAADFLGPASESSGGLPLTQAPLTGLTAVPVLALTLY